MTVSHGLPRTFRRADAILGESLVYAPDAGMLWCDITAGLLHVSPIAGPEDGSLDTTFALPAPLASFGRRAAADVTLSPRALGPHDDVPAASGFVASLGDRVVLLDDHGAIERELANIRHSESGLRLNEGKCDPYGRWVTGSMNLVSGAPDGAIHQVSATGDQRVLRGGFGVANGFEWSADGSVMYFTDTSVETIYRADYSPDGELGEVTVFHAGEAHDGLAIDAEGYLWSGIYGGGRVVRYSPDGVEDLVIELPAPNITSVAFGGEGLSTLFVASARENLTEEDLVEHPLSGSVFAIETGIHGFYPRFFDWVSN